MSARRVRAAARGLLAGAIVAAVLQWPDPPQWEATGWVIALGIALGAVTLAVITDLATGSGDR